jgi:hypothetical protein
MNPTTEQRLAILNDVLYEMEMFVHLPLHCDLPILQNTVTESYLIHARVLCDFFQKDRYSDDVVCDDFGFSRSPLGVPEGIEGRFDKCLAHLTYSRLKFTGDARLWISDYFRPQLTRRIKEFLMHIVANPVPGQPNKITQRAQDLLARLQQCATAR